MNSDNWDDLRFVLAVHDLGSVLRAARHFGVTHATVLRRVAAFEERHGAVIFERTPQGYRLLPDKEPVIRAARDAAAAMTEVNRLARGGAGEMTGVIRIATTDSLARHVMPGFVQAMTTEFTGVSLHVLSSNMRIDLGRAQADLSLRPATQLPGDLHGTVVGEFAFGCFQGTGSRTDRWLGLLGPLSRTVVAKWMSEEVAPDQIGPGADSFLTLADLAAQGLGVAALPAFVGRADPRLSAVDMGLPNLTVPVWVVRPDDTNQSATVRAVEDRLIRYMRKTAPLL